MKRDEGLSLIELVVVIAIMAVLVSLVGISVTVLSRQRVSNAVEDVKVLFQTAQTIAMSKDNCHVAIDQNADDETVFTVYSSSNNTVLNRITISSKIIVSVITDDPDHPIDVGDKKVVRIFYDRVSGSFSDMYWEGDPTLNGSNGKGMSIPGKGVTGIVFSNGGSSTITLKLTKLTGRVSY